jgi:two-component system, LytTR family, sensor kinase
MNQLIRIVIRFKILHILFWYYSFTSQLHLVQYLNPDEKYAELHFVNTFCGLFFQICCAYSWTWWLFPKLFERGRYLLFVLSCLGVTILLSVLLVLSQVTYTPLVLDLPIESNLTEFYIVFASSFVDMMVSSSFVLGASFAYSYFHKEKQHQEIENKKLEAELVQLKSQLNPEFILETLNGLYLEMKIDPTHSAAMLKRFSALIEYPSHINQVASAELSKELEHIEHYLAIQQMICSDEVQITYVRDIQSLEHQLPPFLMIPLIENAFKHGSKGNKQEHLVTISIVSDATKLTMDVANSVQQESRLLNRSDGKTLDRLRRRLLLHYPERHVLEIHSTGTLYAVKLEITW